MRINNEITGINKDIVYFIGRQEKLAEYSEDAKTYMWETRNIARDFNFYTALDSLNSIDFNNMAEQYTAAFQTLLNNVTDAEFIVTAQEKIKKTTDSSQNNENKLCYKFIIFIFNTSNFN